MRIVILIGIMIVTVWGAWGVFSVDLHRWLGLGTDLEEIALWGDSFGVINALISALGFTAVLATLIVQARAVADQAEDLHRQRFESSFFELLGLMRELRENVTYQVSQKYMESRDSSHSKRAIGGFKVSTVDIRSRHGHFSRIRKGHDGIVAAVTELRYWAKKNSKNSDPRQNLVSSYDEFVYRRWESSFSPYFRIVYTILMRIREDSVLSCDEKAQYSNLLRSQLTSHEITLLAINGLASVSKDLDDLLTEFRMLKYMPEGSARRMLENIYKPEAFMPRS
ncbi:putative phage abortive infection protein [Tritonibacter mobilis]|uniref:putative phage abortive infection protein n=1 Tax=Tritonibacter mobilis TaxID=379347 RepID=UPI001C0963B4|nr:putative phage abortive infection protein [Tritonibacter mobilis]MBU3035457.1 putative phage abortive infection protein [Tritonibacter mobilis]WHQ83917.1 putative phage abortive infection protein [Tritonibacter mobilis]